MNFEAEIHALSNEKEISKRSKLKNLCQFLRNDGILLVGGRLKNAEITYNQMHPIVLSANHKVTRLIF